MKKLLHSATLFFVLQQSFAQAIILRDPEITPLERQIQLLTADLQDLK